MASRMAVVLVSGGLDSSVAAALAGQEGSLAMLHLQFGQQSSEPEMVAFNALCEHLRPAQKLAASLGDWRNLTLSPWLKTGGDLEDAATVGGQIARHFVPMLTASMLCAAAAWAHTLGAGRVIWGASLGNPANAPDRADAVRLLTWQLVSRCLPGGSAPALEAPLIQYSKPAVVELARQLNVPIEKTWSCLRGLDQPCGRCVGCAARHQAMKGQPARA